MTDEIKGADAKGAAHDMENRRTAHEYDDIINLPHHVSRTHAPMSRENRAAQFSPFAALTGYGKAVEETARRAEEALDRQTVYQRIEATDSGSEASAADYGGPGMPVPSDRSID